MTGEIKVPRSVVISEVYSNLDLRKVFWSKWTQRQQRNGKTIPEHDSVFMRVGMHTLLRIGHEVEAKLKESRLFLKASPFPHQVGSPRQLPQQVAHVATVRFRG